MKPEPKKQGRGIHQILMFQLDKECLKAQKFLLFIVKLFLKIQFLLK